MMQGIDRIPDSAGHIVMKEDGAVVASGGDLENDEVMADQLMRLTRLSLKVLQSSNSSANFRRLSVIWDDFQYVITVSNHRVFVCKRRPDPVV
ncbi:hypothetical protein NP493_1071g00064 [Ridgeia piscesae]|uniref:Late endosomal/lysosomal adaptor and MAPK and MTOR activator 4 n=1 Tax=Ridgeia piscesae TaxID=27915 RepID=A0AAD9KHV2_RIDPI|nr:hypothetical protein NP493_1071g00064 [Ridgeia piscesae]